MSTPSLFDFSDDETGEAVPDGSNSSEGISASHLPLLRHYIEDDGVSESDVRAELLSRFGSASLEDLTKWQAATLLLEMQRRERFQEREKADKAPPDETQR